MERIDGMSLADLTMLRSTMSMGTIMGKYSLITGVMQPFVSPNNQPLVLISRFDNPDNDEVGNEVIMLTLQQTAFMMKALPRIVEHLQAQGYTLPEIEETPFA